MNVVVNGDQGTALPLPEPRLTEEVMTITVVDPSAELVNSVVTTVEVRVLVDVVLGDVVLGDVVLDDIVTMRHLCV
jgi:hypothetical protein